MTRISRTCTGPMMDRCRLPPPGMGMGMGMGKMGMGKMGMGKMGMGGADDEAEAVGDPHLTLSSGAKQDLCCEGGHCEPCPIALNQQEPTAFDEQPLEDEAFEQAFSEDENMEMFEGPGGMGMGMGGMG